MHDPSAGNPEGTGDGSSPEKGPGVKAHRAWLSFGANIGEREKTIARALAMIAATPGVELLRISALYATDPVGYLDQPEFINGAAMVKTTLAPEELLAKLRSIELELGRVGRTKWREREIDIDIILIDDLIIRTERLTVPHPEMERRGFVLVPLAEIAPDVVHPVLGRRVEELLAVCGDTGSVRRMDLRFTIDDVRLGR